MKGFKIILIVMFIGLAVATLWDKIPAIKTTVHSLLDPSAGILLEFHPTMGLILLSALLALITTLFQKYGTDQETLKSIKEEQKSLQKQMEEYKDHPEKLMEFQKKQFELMGKMMPISMRPVIYTSIPFILLFRWFNDFFIAHPQKILYMNWLLAYIVLSIIFSSIFRKVMKVH